MGATPSSALAIAVVPYGPAACQEAELGDLLAGAVKVQLPCIACCVGETGLGGLGGAGRGRGCMCDDLHSWRMLSRRVPGEYTAVVGCDRGAA